MSRRTPRIEVQARGARTQVFLPFEGSGLGHRFLRTAIVATRRDQVRWHPSGGFFSVARCHTRAVLRALVERYGEVDVLVPSGWSKCTSVCWDATGTACDCACTGLFHGSQERPGSAVAGQVVGIFADGVEVAIYKDRSPLHNRVTRLSDGTVTVRTIAVFVGGRWVRIADLGASVQGVVR